MLSSPRPLKLYFLEIEKPWFSFRIARWLIAWLGTRVTSPHTLFCTPNSYFDIYPHHSFQRNHMRLPHQNTFVQLLIHLHRTNVAPLWKPFSLYFYSHENIMIELR
jgi:hypothetical protein